MNKSAWIVPLFMLIVGLSAGYWLADAKQDDTQNSATVGEKKVLFYRNPMNPSITSPTPAKDSMGMDYIPVYAEQDQAEATRKILFYRNPMNPSVTSPTPAKGSMGMDYIPVYAETEDDSKASAGTVKIDGVTVQNIGVRSTTAVLDTLSHTVRAVGRVAYNEERMVHLHPKTEGWVEKLYVNKTGQWVKKDTDLLSIYSPQLVVSQQEYILALNNLKALVNSPIDDIRHGAEQLVKSSRERLRLLDVPAHRIRDLERGRKLKKSLHIHAPANGIVMNIGVRTGQFVTSATEIYMIADLSKVWVYADIYEYELPWVKQGDSVDMQLNGIPGRTFKGYLAFIYPYAEAKTRTIKVRMVFDNPDLLLKPDMFAEVTIHSDKQRNAVIIPSEAVIRSGSRNQVFVVRAAGKFEPRLVTLGLASNGKVIVIEGIEAGEKVVTSAQFLIDSESKLREATAKMLQAADDNPLPADDSPSMNHTEHHKMILSDNPVDHTEMEHIQPEMEMKNDSPPMNHTEHHKMIMSDNPGDHTEMEHMQPEMEMKHD